MPLRITHYQIRTFTYYAKAAGLALLVIIISGNIIAAFIKDKIRVDKNAYTLVNGYPVFSSEKDYIHLIRHYPGNPGVMLNIHEMKNGESYWDITKTYNISLDTLIAANPFITTLAAEEGKEIVIPLEDGVLMPFNTFIDVIRMKKLLGYTGEVKGKYLPTVFRLISTDDIRLVFFKHAKPAILNEYIARLYNFRKVFQSPIEGNFSSLYGNRVDPFNQGIDFHDGIDIMARYGEPVKPAREGMVMFTGWRDGLGRTIIIQHHDGYTTVYGHCATINTYKGEWVTKESQIGTIGSTGRSTGPHLHFIIMHHGIIIDPIKLIW